MRALAAQGLAGELNALAVVDETVEDGIGVPITSCHLSTGNWLVTMVERRP